MEQVMMLYVAQMKVIGKLIMNPLNNDGNYEFRELFIINDFVTETGMASLPVPFPCEKEEVIVFYKQQCLCEPFIPNKKILDMYNNINSYLVKPDKKVVTRGGSFNA